jgi:hypothetical protein
LAVQESPNEQQQAGLASSSTSMNVTVFFNKSINLELH